MKSVDSSPLSSESEVSHESLHTMHIAAELLAFPSPSANLTLSPPTLPPPRARLRPKTRPLPRHLPPVIKTFFFHAPSTRLSNPNISVQPAKTPAYDVPGFSDLWGTISSTSPPHPQAWKTHPPFCNQSARLINRTVAHLQPALPE